jgi:hypothetical protein
MTATLTTAGLAYARSACQRALAFFYDPAPRGSEKQREQAHNAIGHELERAIQWPEGTQFELIAAMVLTAPGIERAIVQHTASLNRTFVVRGSNGQEIPLGSDGVTDTFRVFIHTGKKHAEATHADLLTAVRDAFERADAKLPEGFPK